MLRRLAALATLLAAVALPTLVLAQSPPQYGDDIYRPSVGQPGKDVVWVPTPDALVTRMLQAARTTDKDFVVDLGAGDGKIAIAAARQFGAQAMGIEFNKDMADLAKRNVQRAGLDGKVTIVEGDIFKEDFSKASVVTMYLLPELNLRLRPIILEMKPGTRVVAHQFHMGEWEPDEVFEAEGRTGYLWHVPAKVAGDWTLREEGTPGEVKISIAQSFQRLGGTVGMVGKTLPLLGASVRGRDLAFTYVDSNGVNRSFRGSVEGNSFEGRLYMPSGGWSAATGRRG